MRGFSKSAWRLIRNEDAATAIEYAFLAALLAMAIVASLRIIGTDLAGTFTDVRSGLVALEAPTP
jgi:pilus assembly protein Flp/PilA